MFEKSVHQEEFEIEATEVSASSAATRVRRRGLGQNIRGGGKRLRTPGRERQNCLSAPGQLA